MTIKLSLSSMKKECVRSLLFNLYINGLPTLLEEENVDRACGATLKVGGGGGGLTSDSKWGG